MATRLIRNVIHQGRTTDILIEDNRFRTIAPRIAEQADEILDCHGEQAILPPFYNTHTHAAMTLLRGYADDLPLFDWLHHYIWPMEARMSPDDIAVGTRLACLEMIRSGTVFFNDMYWHLPQVIQAAAGMGLRFCAGPILLDAFDPTRSAPQKETVAEFLDALDDLPPRMIPAITPHSIYGVRTDTLAWIAETAAAHGVRIHIHLSETEKERNDCLAQHGATPTEYLDRLGLLTPRTLAAHAVWLDDAERDRLAGRGVTLAHMPVSNMKLSSGAFDARAALRQGLRVTLGTDGCSSNNCLDMMQEMKFAALLAKLTSRDPTTLPAQTVYDMASRAGAEAFGLEAGRIEAGWLADALLVDLSNTRLVPGHNRISDMVYSADSSVIRTVFCDGEVLMRDGVIPGETQILQEAREAAQRLRQSAD